MFVKFAENREQIFHKVCESCVKFDKILGTSWNFEKFAENIGYLNFSRGYYFAKFWN